MFYTTVVPDWEGRVRKGWEEKQLNFRGFSEVFGIVRNARDPEMAPSAGFEPATCRLGGGCSILLS